MKILELWQLATRVSNSAGRQGVSGSAPRDIGGQPLPCREQFLLVHDVVAIKHRARLMAREQHRDPLRHTRADQVARGRAPTIVEEPMRDLGLAAGIAQRGAPRPDRDPVAAKHTRIPPLLPTTATLQPPSLPRPLLFVDVVGTRARYRRSSPAVSTHRKRRANVRRALALWSACDSAVARNPPGRRAPSCRISAVCPQALGRDLAGDSFVHSSLSAPTQAGPGASRARDHSAGCGWAHGSVRRRFLGRIQCVVTEGGADTATDDGIADV
jgi:hypothetical protein